MVVERSCNRATVNEGSKDRQGHRTDRVTGQTVFQVVGDGGFDCFDSVRLRATNSQVQLQRIMSRLLVGLAL